MNENDNNLDYTDLLIAFIKGELNEDLHLDITNTLLKDPILSATVDGLKKLLDDHQGDKVTLKKYFNSTQNKMFSTLSDQKQDV